MAEKYTKRPKFLIDLAFKHLEEGCRLVDVTLPDNDTFRIHFYDKEQKYKCQLFPLPKS